MNAYPPHARTGAETREKKGTDLGEPQVPQVAQARARSLSLNLNLNLNLNLSLVTQRFKKELVVSLHAYVVRLRVPSFYRISLKSLSSPSSGITPRAQRKSLRTLREHAKRPIMSPFRGSDQESCNRLLRAKPSQ